MSITFEIDPSLSFIKDENIYLANYLKDKFLSIDIYDADTRFQFGSCKLPLFELLRQQKTEVIRAKDCEISSPYTAEPIGSI